MVRIKNEHDLETLRQITLLVDNENQRLVNENVRLRVELARLHGVPETEQLELSVLKQLQEKRESIFRIDEKRTRKKTKAKKNKKKGHGPREQPHLPVVDKVIELAETEKKCSVCDGEMAGQYEESEVVTVVKRSFVIERHLRKKYRCRCNANVVTAPAATKLQPGGRYSVEFATEVAISKYLDHMPLERQVRMMRREGLDIDSQTLWDQLNVLARHLNPVYDALGEKVLESPVIHADETRWPLMGSMKKSAGTVWGVSSPDIAYYRMLPTKSTEDGQKVLGTYSGIAVVDGYAVYEVLARAGPDGYAARAGPQFRLAHCWAHVKRKFDEASEHYPQACSEVLRLIGELYEVEREVPGPFPGDEKAQKLRLCLRKQRSQRILKAIRQWGESQRGLPRSDFGKAVRYMLERWETLTLFAENPLVSGTVTGSRYLLSTGERRLLVDAGLFQGLKKLRLLNWQEPDFEPSSVDQLLLTHAHIDHSGYLPRLVRNGYSGPIYCTPATLDLAKLLLMDAAKIQEEGANYANKRGFSKHRPALPLYTSEDAGAAIEQMRAVPYGEWLELRDGAKVRFLNVGHILGSAMIELHLSSGTEETRLVFSGDVGRYGVPLHSDPMVPPTCDFLVVESTYGNRAHDHRPLKTQLSEPIKKTFERGGIVLIPSFAVGRAQLVTLILRELMNAGDLPAYPSISTVRWRSMPLASTAII